MKRAATAALLALAACKPASPEGDQAGKGPPAPPPYMMRAEMPAGDRLASGRDGAALFSNRCGSCHLAGGMASNMLTKQMVLAGRPPSDGLLANRTDLTQSYVKAVVRNGKVAMPRLSRVEVTDAELDAIAGYIGKAGK